MPREVTIADAVIDQGKPIIFEAFWLIKMLPILLGIFGGLCFSK